MDLADFLLARVAEDEAAARAAVPVGRWEVRASGHGGHSIVAPDVPSVGLPDYPSTVFDDEGGAIPPEVVTMEHIARHNPAHVLAECDAKRRIVQSRPAVDAPGPMLEVVHAEVQRQREYVWRLLALPYADHESYRDEWRP